MSFPIQMEECLAYILSKTRLSESQIFRFMLVLQCFGFCLIKTKFDSDIVGFCFPKAFNLYLNFTKHFSSNVIMQLVHMQIKSRQETCVKLDCR